MQPVNPLEHPDWDATLARRPDFSFFHSAAWTHVLVDTYAYTPLWICDNGAVLPLMEVNSWLTGRRGISLPFTDTCEPLCESPGEFKSLFEQAVSLGRQREWDSIELRGGHRFLGGAPASLSFYGHRLDLAAGESAIFAAMDGSARQAVRKAEKDGVKVEVSHTEEAMRQFFDLQCLTRKRHGLPPQPWNFFLNIWRHILSQKRGIVVLAESGGAKIAGAVYFYAGTKAIYKYGASDLNRQQSRPNNLVMWEGIKWLARNGIKTLDLGKTSLMNEGLRKFKLNLGTVEERTEYAKFNLRRNRFEVETDQITGWHNRVFRNLPVFMSRKAGELLYKHWA